MKTATTETGFNDSRCMRADPRQNGASHNSSDQPDELDLWDKHAAKTSKGISSPYASGGFRGGRPNMSREWSTANSAVIGPAKPPLPSEALLFNMRSSTTHKNMSSTATSPVAGAASRANADMQSNFSRSGSQQPDELPLGRTSFASSTLDSVISLPPAHAERASALVLVRGLNPKAATTSRVSLAHFGSGMQPVSTGDGILFGDNHDSSAATKPAAAAAESVQGALGSDQGSDVQRLPKSFSAPNKPDSLAGGHSSNPLVKPVFLPAAHRPPLMTTQSRGADGAEQTTEVDLLPLLQAKKQQVSQAGSVAITSGFTRSIHTGDRSPRKAARTGSPIASSPVVKILKQEWDCMNHRTRTPS